MIANALDVIKFYTKSNKARYLDIGCGTATMGLKIRALGGQYCGIDPQASEREGLVRAMAEALPFNNASFDHALFINSLHHVATPHMGQALIEARRVIKSHGTVVIIEPDVEGALSQVLSVIDDESEVRLAAQVAIDQSVQQGAFKIVVRDRYMRYERFENFDQFCVCCGAVDARRPSLISKHREALSKVFRQQSTKENDYFILSQPMNFVILEPYEN